MLAVLAARLLRAIAWSASSLTELGCGERSQSGHKAQAPLQWPAAIIRCHGRSPRSIGYRPHCK